MPDHEHKYKEIRVTKANGDEVYFSMADPECEPVFLLRAQDQFAWTAVDAYSHRLRMAGLDDQADHAMEHANEMRRWPDQKQPD